MTHETITRRGLLIGGLGLLAASPMRAVAQGGARDPCAQGPQLRLLLGLDRDP